MEAVYHQPWTEQRIARAKELWHAGRSGSEIARDLGGTTRNAVIGLAHRKKWRKRALGLSSQTRNRISVSHQLRSIHRVRSANAKAMAKRKQSPAREMLCDTPTEPLPPIDTMTPTLSWAKLENTTDVITQCRAILPADGDKTICGRKTVVGTSWCECHLRRYAVPVIVKKTHPDRPAWQDNRTGSKGAVFLSGREKMKAY